MHPIYILGFFRCLINVSPSVAAQDNEMKLKLEDSKLQKSDTKIRRKDVCEHFNSFHF